MPAYRRQGGPTALPLLAFSSVKLISHGTPAAIKIARLPHTPSLKGGVFRATKTPPLGGGNRAGLFATKMLLNLLLKFLGARPATALKSLDLPYNLHMNWPWVEHVFFFPLVCY